ncbi:MAG: hypothetical protein R3336_04240 [Phycisphaeraceae bacterium]|nr:hypothetical protein [Phycisphaeraceae bacterium]
MIVRRLVLVLAVATLVACAKDQNKTRPTPSLQEIESTRPDPEGAQVVRPDYAVQVLKITVSADTPLHDAWALTSRRQLSSRAVQRWEANGMTAGLVPIAGLRKLLKEIPDRHTNRVITHMVADNAVALSRTDWISRPIEWQLVGEQGEQTRVARRGRFQALLNVYTENVPTVTIRPHLYQSKRTLQPRTPQEKQFDGILFEPLSLSADLPRGVALLIGPDPGPAPEKEVAPVEENASSTESSDTADETSEEDEGENDSSSEDPPQTMVTSKPLPRLGDLLFQRQFRRARLTNLLLITVKPVR